ncbi:MAG: molybdopterin biosynthesis protein [Isosphaeraceae bacterium]|nr:molybdopterin biosynthesis protein [Isosphaeraceae bacterium]
MAREQEQFLEVVDRDTAERRWWDLLRPHVLPLETAPLEDAFGRVLADDVFADVDVPAFDRSNVDGYAARAEDTYGASEEGARTLRLNSEEVATGFVPRLTVAPGTATPIATGGMVPRGADAVVMVEHAEIWDEELAVRRPVAPGAGITFAGTDMARGELVLRKGTALTSRETGVLAAIGRDAVPVVRRPRVAIVSTGDEIVAPGEPMRPAGVYDANATLLADAVRELGGDPLRLGVVPDDENALAHVLDRALACDLVLVSGGTSKGAGDVSYRVLAKRTPGIVVHGVALKPGKPICLGAVGAVPVAILPGFPTSAIFTFHELVAPLILCLAGRQAEPRDTLKARMPARVNSEVGRTEFLLVNLVRGPEGLAAYPLGKGSGSVTTFSRADGFVVIPRTREYVEAEEAVDVFPLARGASPADLVAIGSHCVGLDMLLGLLGEQGYRAKTLWVGSQGGLVAAGRGECDIAGVHLLDGRTGTYNRPFLPPGVRLLEGYGRLQGVVHRRGDRQFEGRTLAEALAVAAEDSRCLMVNRNRGSGTRVLIDELLSGKRPHGYAVEARSHNAVAASVVQGRADWGVAIAPVAKAYGLGFLPLRDERYDFAIPESRWDRPAVTAFRALLAQGETRAKLVAMGFRPGTGESAGDET